MWVLGCGKGQTMKPLLRALALGVAPVVMAVGVGVGSQPGRTSQIALPPSVAAASCTQPPVFQTGYQRDDNGLVAVGQGYKFNGMSWIQANLCSAGILKITASGEVAGDELPQLTVLQDDQTLAVLGFDQQEKIAEVKIPHPGNVYIAYFNDYYISEARIATLQTVNLVAADCSGFKSVDVPKATGGVWNAQASSVVLVFSVPMTLIPCDAGQLSFKIIGHEAKKAFPEVSFRQDDKTIKTVVAGARSQLIQLDISAAPITVRLTNPYFAQLADRNLDVKRIKFIPTQP